jgi:hypothetical protein
MDGTGLEWFKSSFSFAQSNCVEVAWRKATASYANGRCIEVGYQKSTFSANGSCIEVGSGTDGACGMIHVRDSKDPEGPVLSFTPSEWTAFVAGVRNGEFDL